MVSNRKWPDSNHFQLGIRPWTKRNYGVPNFISKIAFRRLKKGTKTGRGTAKLLKNPARK